MGSCDPNISWQDCPSCNGEELSWSEVDIDTVAKQMHDLFVLMPAERSVIDLMVVALKRHARGGEPLA